MALGINETAGYLGVAVTALATGYLATGFGLRPAPELLGAATRIALREYRPVSAPPAALVSALASPKTTTNAAMASSPRWNCSDPTSGVTVR